MHALSVGAIFKNEEFAMREWIEHYLHHGVEHFYMIDDNSTDASVAILQPYVERGLVTLVHVEHPYYLGRQRDLYNAHVLPHINETHWMLMADLDEFVWSPRAIDLRDVLASLDHIAQIQMEHTLFGSNGHIDNPPGGIVASYTRRAKDSPTRDPGLLKYFVNSTNATHTSLGVHYADFVPHEGKEAHFYNMDSSWFVLNHYCCQSREFWRDVKCKRGDADDYLVRTMADFEKYDLNDVEDTRLLGQNRSCTRERIVVSEKTISDIHHQKPGKVSDKWASYLRYYDAAAITHPLATDCDV
jgi:hypothetical protein